MEKDVLLYATMNTVREIAKETIAMQEVKHREHYSLIQRNLIDMFDVITLLLQHNLLDDIDATLVKVNKSVLLAEKLVPKLTFHLHFEISGIRKCL